MSKVKTVSLTQAVKDENIEEVVAAVDAAVKMYPADCPAVPTVNTVYGSIKLDNAIIDDETRIMFATENVAGISIQADSLPDNSVKELEIAKLIATNPVLRNIAASKTTGLL